MYIEFGDCIYLYQNRKSRPSVEYIQAIFVWSVKFYLHKHFVSIYCLLVVGPTWKLLIVDSTCDFFLLLEYLLSGRDTLSFFFSYFTNTHTHSLTKDILCRQTLLYCVWASTDKQQKKKTEGWNHNNNNNSVYGSIIAIFRPYFVFIT